MPKAVTSRTSSSPAKEDVVLKMIPPHAFDSMRSRCPQLQDVVIVPGAGPLVQQEEPQAVNAAR